MIHRGFFKDYEIICARGRSGIGVRLRFLLGAIVIADALGAKFKFHWPTRSSDGIYPAEMMFDDGFLREYHLSALPPLNKMVIDHEVQPKHVVYLRRQILKRIIVYTQMRSGGNCDITSRYFDLGFISFREAYQRIRFHPDLEIIRDYVNSNLPQFALAIHIRRGDIVDTLSRIGGYFAQKILPLPLIRYLIASFQSDVPVIIIGQDQTLIQRLMTKPNIYSLNEFRYPGERTPIKDDFFDFCALTKCDAVIGGKSNFATLPARIAKSRVMTWRDIISPEKLKEILLDYIRYPTPGDPVIEVGLTCEFIRAYGLEDFSPTDISFLLKRSLESDPVNPVYPLRIASDMLKNMDFAGANKVINNSILAGALTTTIELARLSRIGHPDAKFKKFIYKTGFIRESDWDILKSYSSKVLAVNYYLGLRCIAQGNEKEAFMYFQQGRMAHFVLQTNFDDKGFISSVRDILAITDHWK